MSATTIQLIALETVNAAFPGVGFVALMQCAKFIGLAEKTARNWQAMGKFPIPTVKVGDKRFVTVPSLVEWYQKKLIEAGVTGSGEVTPSPAVQTADAVKRGRGRPRKVALQQEGGV